jgi:hypothetical protein
MSALLDLPGIHIERPLIENAVIVSNFNYFPFAHKIMILFSKQKVNYLNINIFEK